MLPALRSLVSGLAGDTGIRVRENYPAFIPDLGTTLSTVIYRIAEHGLKFLLAHDDIRDLEVRLTLPTDRLSLRLEAAAPMATSASALRADTLPLEIDLEAIKDYGGSLSFTGGSGLIQVDLSLPVTPA